MVNKIFRYPVLIDAVIQSSGIGMIGMEQSTMSLLAGRPRLTALRPVFDSYCW